MLFPRLQGVHKTTLALGVHGLPHDAARHLADMLFFNRHKTQIRAAETQRQAQALAFARGDIRAQLSRIDARVAEVQVTLMRSGGGR